MKMMRSTSTTSTSGVTLIPEIMSSSAEKPPATRLLRELSDEEALQRLGLCKRCLHLTLENVERDNRRNRDKQADRRSDQGFGNTRSNGLHSCCSLFREVMERLDN